MRKILITGATGEVARGVVPFLHSQFDLKLLSPNPDPRDPRSVRGDILDINGMTEALRGIEGVLHLAIAAGHSGTFEDDGFNLERFDVNVKGTYNVFEAARRAGVRRVVSVSSLMVTWGHAQSKSPAKIQGNARARPVGAYALTKALAEEVARYFAESTSLQVITLRISAPFAPEKIGAEITSLRPQQIPFPDLAQAFAQALTVPLQRYEVVSVAGHSRKCLWSLETARQILGYEPTIDLDDLDIKLLPPFAVAAE